MLWRNREEVLGVGLRWWARLRTIVGNFGVATSLKSTMETQPLDRSAGRRADDWSWEQVPEEPVAIAANLARLGRKFL